MPSPPIASTSLQGFVLQMPDKKHRRSPQGSNESKSSSDESRGSATGVVAQPAQAPTMLLRRPQLVHRDTTNDLVHRAGITTFPPAADLEAQRAREAEGRPAPAKNMVFFDTRFKPFWLLGIGAMGNWLYGTGTVAIERGIFPRRPFSMPNAPTDSLPPVFQPLFGRRSASIGVGGTSTVAGAGLALLSFGLGYQDARRLARKQNSAAPNYTRANVYAACHFAAIVLSVGYKFSADAIRDTVPRDYVWAAALPGWIGQAAFAVTQAQAFSNCELQNGKMPLKHRGQLGFAARTAMGFFSLYGVMAGIPYFNAYGKEIIRLTAVTASTLAYSLPLTTARISRQAALVPRPDDAPPPESWRAFYVLATYLAGRVLAGFGPDLVQQGTFASAGADQTVRAVTDIFGGSLMLAAGTSMCVVALMLFRDDARRYDPRRGDWLLGMGVGALLLIEVYRILLEYGLNARVRQLVWVAVLPGLVGTGLRFAVLPELFCYSELYNGDLPLRHRYQWTEAARATAQLGFGVWGAMCAVPGFNTYVRESVGIVAGALATLGMALPTTTSRRTLPQYAWPLSPGATPTGERRDPFNTD